MAWKKTTRRGKHPRYPTSSPPQNEVNHQLLEIQSKIAVAKDNQAHLFPEYVVDDIIITGNRRFLFKYCTHGKMLSPRWRKNIKNRHSGLSVVRVYLLDTLRINGFYRTNDDKSLDVLPYLIMDKVIRSSE